MKFLKKIMVAFLFLIAITFSLKNNEMVTLRYYFQELPLEVPLYLLVFCSVILGILLGGVEGVMEKIRTTRTIRRLKKELDAKERELTSLRNLPITETENKLPATTEVEAKDD